MIIAKNCAVVARRFVDSLQIELTQELTENERDRESKKSDYKYYWVKHKKTFLNSIFITTVSVR